MLAEVLLIFVLPSPPHDILESSGASQVEDIDLLSQERFSLLKDNFRASQSWRICSSEAWLPTSSAFRFPSSPGRCAAVNLKEICFCQGMPLTSIGKGKWEQGDAKWWFSSFFFAQLMDLSWFKFQSVHFIFTKKLEQLSSECYEIFDELYKVVFLQGGADDPMMGRVYRLLPAQIDREQHLFADRCLFRES